jgi:hypothetical protein
VLGAESHTEAQAYCDPDTRTERHTSRHTAQSYAKPSANGYASCKTKCNTDANGALPQIVSVVAHDVSR